MMKYVVLFDSIPVGIAKDEEGWRKLVNRCVIDRTKFAVEFKSQEQEGTVFGPKPIYEIWGKNNYANDVSHITVWEVNEV